MANYTYVEPAVESKSEKRVRYFMAFLFFVQTVCTTLPFVQGTVDGEFRSISAFQLLIQPDGYSGQGDLFLAIVGGLLVVMPITAFFFCVLDSRSRVKYIATGLCSVLSAALITFGYMFSLGAIITLLLNIICLFMTMQGLQGTNTRMKSQKS